MEPYIELPHLAKKPKIPASCFIDVSSRINGDVVLGERCSVWFNVSIRGDVHEIRVGNRTNIQDNTTFHATYQAHGLYLGDDVSVGHQVLLHGCRIGSRVLVGMQSVIMDGAQLGDDILLGAGSLVTEGKKIPSGMLAYGRPAKVIRPLSDEERVMVAARAAKYTGYMDAYRRQGRFTGWSQP